MVSDTGYDQQKWLERLIQMTPEKPSRANIRRAIDSLHDEIGGVLDVGANNRLVAQVTKYKELLRKLADTAHTSLYNGYMEEARQLLATGQTKVSVPVSYTHLTLPTKRIV